jgi:adenosylhomocysteinase
LAGKVAKVARYGDAGKGSPQSLCGCGCRVIVTTVEDSVSRCNILVSTTGCKDILNGKHIVRNAIICNIGYFDCELQVKWLKVNCKQKLESQLQPFMLTCSVQRMRRKVR